MEIRRATSSSERRRIAEARSQLLSMRNKMVDTTIDCWSLVTTTKAVVTSSLDQQRTIRSHCRTRIKKLSLLTNGATVDTRNNKDNVDDVVSQSVS